MHHISSLVSSDTEKQCFHSCLTFSFSPVSHCVCVYMCVSDLKCVFAYFFFFFLPNVSTNEKQKLGANCLRRRETEKRRSFFVPQTSLPSCHLEYIQLPLPPPPPHTPLLLRQLAVIICLCKSLNMIHRVISLPPP